MENFKRSVKRLITRLTILGLVVICGAIAIAQAQRERVVANAAAPDLGAPAAAFNDAGSAALAVPDLKPVAKPATWEGQPDQRTDFMLDDNVATAQAIEDTSRFEDTFPTAEVSDAPRQRASGNRFANSDAKFDQGRSKPPALLSDAEIAAPPLNSPLPPADTSMPKFDQAQRRDFAPTPPQNQPTPATAPRSANASDAFGVQPPPASNPIRGNGAPAVHERAPVAAAAPPAFDQAPAFDAAPTFNSPPAIDSPPTAARQQEAARSTLANGVLPPARSYAKNAVSISGAGKPGPRELEGAQSPSLTIQKIPPTDARVGEPTTFQIKVRNNGQVPAERVRIRDEVPQGTQLVDTNPQASPDSSGAIVWEIGTLRPNEDVTVSMQVSPNEEGVIGSVASVTFQAMASARAEVKRPMLKIEHTAKGPILVGDRVNFTIAIENPGSGPARDVVIEENVPQGLSHSKGPKLEFAVGTIPAGGRRRLELSLKAAEAGMVDNLILARAAGGLVAEHRTQVEVVAPELQVKITGPSKRYLERKATYSLALENAGSAPAKNVELVTQLPPGMKFVSTNNSGRFDSTTNTIRWNLDRLPARQFGEVQFTAVPVQKGEYSIRVDATADAGLSDSKDHGLTVEGLAALAFEVADQVDPIEVGGITTYQIRVRNQGTEQANNVRFVALVPPGMKAVPANGPTKYQIQGNQVLFETIVRLPAKGESTYKVRVEGVQAGDQRFTVQMTSDDTTSPVVEEESTRVYAD